MNYHDYVNHIMKLIMKLASHTGSLPISYVSIILDAFSCLLAQHYAAILGISILKIHYLLVAKEVR